jgi:dihydroflavonol-4-reductase
MKALVTGATGFVGRVLVEKLFGRHYEVRGLVRSGKKDMALRRLGLEVCYEDLLDPDSLKRAAQGMDVVFHTAAKADQWGPRKAYEEANVQGTRHVLEAALAARVSWVIHFRSLVVYGQQTGTLTESTPLQKVGDRYADSKIDAEEMAWDLARKHSLPFTVVRPTSIYGPHRPKWIPTVAENIRKGRIFRAGSFLVHQLGACARRTTRH